MKLKLTRKTLITISYVGYILALIGEIIIILFGLFDLFDVTFRIFRVASILPFFSSTVSALAELVIGAICIIGSRFISKLIWAIILFIFGIIAGTLGGYLVVIGALMGFISTFLKSTPK